MSVPELIVFQGSSSQTGIAFSKEFSIPYQEDTCDFDQIRESIKSIEAIAVLPVWNSHAGEIKKSCVIDMLFDEEARLYYLWPDQIIFECLTRPGKVDSNRAVISVSVAEYQCSEYIDKNYDDFKGKLSTNIAFDVFESDIKYSAVLCPQGKNNGKYELETADASNKANFTTFALLGSPESERWDDDKWEGFPFNYSKGKRIYTVVEMPYQKNLTDSQEEIFNTFIDEAKSLSEMPKIMFVSKYMSSRYRILIEADYEFASPHQLDEEGANDKIDIIQNVGRTRSDYSDRLIGFLKAHEFVDGIEFVKHIGTKSYFYACPTLGVYTHGFEENITESVVRQIVKKCFKLIGQLGVDSQESDVQNLYEKYKEKYIKSDTDFFEFQQI